MYKNIQLEKCQICDNNTSLSYRSRCKIIDDE